MPRVPVAIPLRDVTCMAVAPVALVGVPQMQERRRSQSGYGGRLQLVHGVHVLGASRDARISREGGTTQGSAGQ